MKKILITTILACFVVAEDEFFEPGTTIGGYGELHYTNSANPDCEGDDCYNSTKLDFHRWILFVNYNWTPEWSLKSELEIEHNMIDGNGDYDGEVELEQAYVNYHNANGGWGYGAGVILISAGIINETHEPPTFLSVERPAYNSKIIPTTWFGNGAMVYGSFGDFHAKFVLHEDMKGSGMISGSAFGGLRSGRAKGYKSKAYHWTKNMAVHWTGMEGLNVGGSFTFGGAATDLDGTNPTKDYVDWNLFEVHGQYNANNIIGAFEYGTVGFSHVADNMAGQDAGDDGIWGDDEDTTEIDESADDSNFKLVLPDQVASGYYMQLGYDIAPMLGWEDCKLAPWFGMGMYDLNDLDTNGEKTNTMFGLTWWPNDQISWKFDYDMQVTKNADGSESKANVMSLGVGYMF